MNELIYSGSVGYVPYSADLSHPGDRRRIAIWSSFYGKELNTRDPLRSNLIVLSGLTNAHKWFSQYSGPIILDIVDGYLSYEPSIFEDLGRNIVRSRFGNSSLRFITYTRALTSAIRKADFVVAASEEQGKFLKSINDRVAIIQDCHDELVNPNLIPCKHNHLKGSRFNLMWEGFGFTLKHLIGMSDQLDYFLSHTDSQLAIVTEPKYPKYSVSIGRVDSAKLIKRHFPRSHKRIELIPWNLECMKSIISKANFGIIPIISIDKFAITKSENKLLSYWKSGLPVLASDIPSYIRASTDAGLQEFIVWQEKWEEKLSEMYEKKIDLVTIREKQANYLANHDSKTLAGKWNEIFNLVG